MELVVSVLSSGCRRTLDPLSIHLAGGKTASIRVREGVEVGNAICLHVKDAEGLILCSTEDIVVDFTDEDWVCLHSCATDATDAQPSANRLISYIYECGDGWTLTVDVKEEANAIVIRNVHIFHSEQTFKALRANGNNLPEIEYDGTDVLVGEDVDDKQAGEYWDCTNPRTSVQPSFRSPKSLQLENYLERIATTRDEKFPSWLLEPSLWQSMSRGLSFQERTDFDISHILHQDQPMRVREQLNASGYCILPDLPWCDLGVSLPAIAATMNALRDAGFPPVFVFMYDDMWCLFARLFCVFASILDDVEVTLDTSIFAWALNAGRRTEAGEAVIGESFAKPHRDDAYNECHSANGKLTAISVWIPVVQVTANSGCMYVVPAEHDPLFAEPEHQSHMKPDSCFEFARPLPASAGDVIMWKPNLIHWGASCAEGVEEPRKSVGAAFTSVSPTSACDSTTEGLTQEKLRAGLNADERLRMIIRAIAMYSRWHPEFKGLPGLHQQDR